MFSGGIDLNSKDGCAGLFDYTESSVHTQLPTESEIEEM
jgi:hypothetical protein